MTIHNAKKVDDTHMKPVMQTKNCSCQYSVVGHGGLPVEVAEGMRRLEVEPHTTGCGPGVRPAFNMSACRMQLYLARLMSHDANEVVLLILA